MKFLKAQHDRLELLRVVRAYRAHLRENNLMTFGQQMAMSAQLVSAHPEVGQAQRDRFRVVMLDEYQDTGHAQRVLLRKLFGEGLDPGLAVTAVGDPMQSIYGFRGATASNLENFRQDFPLVTAAEQPTASWKPAHKLELTTSWRNPAEVLKLANVVSDWSMEASSRPRLVSPLRPRPGADAGDIRVGFFTTLNEEIDWVADSMQRLWEEHLDAASPTSGTSQHPFSAAVLIRKNSHAVDIYEALRERGVPAEMTAGPGLLDLPEVSDVYATLRVLVDPEDDPAMIRLLAGSRFNVGAQDIAQLSREARRLQRLNQRAGEATAAEDVSKGSTAEPVEHPLSEELRGFPDELREALLEVLPNQAEVSIGLADVVGSTADFTTIGVSAEGARRLTELSRELGYLRRHSLSKSLPDLIADIEHMTGVRTEVLTRWHRDPNSSIGASHLDQFAGVVKDFAELGGATPSALVDYLRTAHKQEKGLEPGEVQKKENTVQILTVHKAKGLEWENVAVLRADRNEYEDAVRLDSGTGTWATQGQILPTELRGDCDADVLAGAEADDPGAIPVLDTSEAEDRPEHAAEVDKFVKELKRAFAKEADRVFYVAITRTEKVLLVSGSAFVPGTTKGRDPSVMLTLLRNALVDGGGQGISQMDATDGVLRLNSTVPHWSLAGAPASSSTKSSSSKKEQAQEEKPFREDELMTLPSAHEEQRLALAEAQQAASAGEGIAEPWPAPRDTPVLQQLRAGAELVQRALEQQAEGTATGAAGVASTLQDPAGSERAQQWARETALLVEEFHQQSTPVVEIPLGARLTASEAVSIRRDAAEFARRRRRPVPLEPKPYAKRGTAFHNWVEQRYGQDSLLDEDELPGASDASLSDPKLEQLKQAFLKSEWADRTPYTVEGAYSVTIDGHVYEGRIDAVFHSGDDEADGWMVVDWKTGRKPTGPELEAAQMQLAVYRLAWARVMSRKLGREVPVDNVRAAFHYVSTNLTFEPKDLPTDLRL